MFWEFSDSRQLMEALASGIVPEEIVHAETVYSRADDGRLWIWQRKSLPRAAGRKLRELGVRAKKRMPVSSWSFTPGWWGAVPLSRLVDEEIDPSEPVILQVPLGEECSRTLSEIERLGGKIEGFQAPETESRWVFVKVLELPYFSQLTASLSYDFNRQRVFLERLPKLWIEAGYSHPLASDIPIPADSLLLLAESQRVTSLKQHGFRRIGERNSLPVSRNTPAGFHSPAEGTISIPLRLLAQPTLEEARFWIVSKAELHRWITSAGQMLVEQLAVALWPLSDPPLILVRPLSDKHPPVMVWDALAFHPSRILPEVHLPMGYELHPAARPDVLRSILDCQGETLTWMTCEEPSGFGVHAVSLSAFGPLREWVDYEPGQSVLSWQSWSPRLSWETETFEILEETEQRKPKPQRRFKGVESEDQHIRKDPNPKSRSPGQKKSRTPALLKPSNRSLVDLQEQSARKRLAELEATMLASELPLDADEHERDWQDMAGLHFLLQDAPEGMLCLSHALWKGTRLDADWLEAAWLQSRPREWRDSWEIPAVMPSSSMVFFSHWEKLRQLARPSEEALSHWALGLVWLSATDEGTAFLKDHLREMQEFLERFETELPIRVAWLTWRVLTQSDFKDVLTLARARDRFLERLFQRGLRRERDFPRFLGSASATGEARFPKGSRLASFRPILHRWSQSQSRAASNRLQMTAAYLDLILAFGMARQGESAEAQKLLQAAGEVLLRTKDELHRWCLAAYEERIRQALQGENLFSPLNPSLLDSLETFSKRDRFKLDRLRQASRILEPEHARDSFLNYHQNFADDLARDLESLKAITDSVSLMEAFTRMRTSRSHAEESFRITRAGLQLAPRMGSQSAGPLLEEAAKFLMSELPLTERLPLLEESLKVAGHFDLSEWVLRLGHEFRELLEKLSRTEPEAVLSLDRFVRNALLGFRRFGLRAEMAGLLDSLEELARQWETDSSRPVDRAKWLALAAAIAGGRFFFEQQREAWALLDHVREALFSEELSEQKQTHVAQAYIQALGLAPAQLAGERLWELFQELRGIHDAFSTSTHFSLSQLSVVETLVFSLSGDIGLMDPALQRLFDEEEFHVRKRIHHDLREAMREI